MNVQRHDEGMRRSHRKPRITLAATPIDLSDVLRTQLFERFSPIVMTSATLTTAHSFDYLQSRLGTRDVRSLAVGSPFDFAQQAILYAPQDLPDPSKGELFDAAAVDRP